MKYGLFINTDLLTFISTNKSNILKFKGLLKNHKEHLYFTYNKDLDPPYELQPEARNIYFPGNPDIIGDTIHFIDNANEKFKIFDKEFNRYDLLDNIIQQLLSANIETLAKKNIKIEDAPFYLIIPPNVSLRTKKSLIISAQKKTNNVIAIDYVKPYIESLINEDKLPLSGKVLYIEMGFSDIYFRALTTNLKNKRYELKTTHEDKLENTDLILMIFRMVAQELVETALFESDPPLKFNQDVHENDILNNIPAAQDIFSEINNLDDWTSVETDVSISNGNSSPVIIYKDNLTKKLNSIIDKVGLNKKLQILIKKYQPTTIVLNGDNFNNCLLRNYFRKLTECEIIPPQPDSYKKICTIVLGETETIDEQIDDKQKAVDAAEKEIQDPETDLKTILDSGTQLEIKDPDPKNRLLVKILIPVVILIAAFLVYKFIPFDRTENKAASSDVIVQKDSNDVIRESDSATITIINNEVDLKKIEFGTAIGETQTLIISSSGEWNVELIPDWLDVDKSGAMGSETISISTVKENKTFESKVVVVNIVFENNDKKTIEITQLGKVPEPIIKPEEIVISKDTLTKPQIEIPFKKWEFDDLESYLESIRNTSKKIDLEKLHIHIDPQCEVYNYVNGEKLSSENLESFIAKIKFGSTEKLVPNSLKYNSDEKIIEFGQE